MPNKNPLEPLTPLEALKKVVRDLIAVPKEQIDKAEAERQKRKREPKEPC